MKPDQSEAPARSRPVQLGFKTSVITLFVAIVLIIGLALVYLSFERITAVTDTAASQFIGKVAELSADRIGSQLKLVRDNLEILNALPPIQSAEIENNPRLYALLAAMLKNNDQLFSLYVGYDDGSFVQMDDIGGTGRDSRAKLEAPEQAAFRLVVISRSDPAHVKSRRLFLSDKLETIRELPGPLDFDPRERPWYKDAQQRDGSSLTGPYIFFATGKQGYTVRSMLKQGRGGVIAGDLLLDATEEVLKREKLTASGVAFLFDDDDRILAHPRMSEMLGREVSGTLPRLRETDMAGVLKAIRASRVDGVSEQFFMDPAGRRYAAAFQRIPQSGPANLRVAVVAPVDEFFANILSERRRLFIATLGFVAAMVPIVFFIGSMLSKSLRALVEETDRIQRFEPAVGPPVRSAIREIDELGRSVSTMRTLVRNFSSFIPRQIVRQLVQSGASLELGGSRREITVLFTDVADFTSKTEKADPSQVMIHTSRYFAVLSEEIMRHHGTVDKYIGDAVMAFWNAPADDPDHVANACRAVLGCVRGNAELNASFSSEGWPPYMTRFGLHVGDAVVGNVGSSDRMNYTALGANINLAARLEGLNKNYGTQILVSADVKARAGSEFGFRSVDEIKPKGFAEAFAIYELRGECARDGSPELAFCQRWDAVYAAIQHEDATAALTRISDFLDQYPGDGVAQYHAERLRAVIQSQRFPEISLD